MGLRRRAVQLRRARSVRHPGLPQHQRDR